MNKVENFMSRLHAQIAPMMKKSLKSNEKKLEKISLNHPSNFGRYQILPVDNIVTDYPFVTLFNTREISIPRTYTNADGTSEVRTSWIKIIPKEGYIMKDQTGRTVSSLTNEDETLLFQASTLFDELYSELDAKNQQDICKGLIRKRNYTIFNGYCSQRWSEGNSGRTPDREHFSALFIATAKGFVSAVDKNIADKNFEMGTDDNSWLLNIYNRELEGRNGCMMMTIGQAKAGVGFDVSINHIVGNCVKDQVIPTEDMELMTDPVATFLGWQARREDESVLPENRRLFNPSLIKEVINFMTQKLAALRMAKSASDGQDMKAIITKVIKDTNDAAIANSDNGVQTNDPMLKQEATVSVERLEANNTTPFQNPPVMHASPVNPVPVENQNQSAQAAPFSAPSFANFGNNTANNTAASNDAKSDLPF